MNCLTQHAQYCAKMVQRNRIGLIPINIKVQKIRKCSLGSVPCNKGWISMNNRLAELRSNNLFMEAQCLGQVFLMYLQYRHANTEQT